MRRTARIVLLIAVVAAIGVGVYLAWPVVYDRYLAPVQTNTADVGTLREEVADLQRQIDDLVAADADITSRLGSIDQRLVDHDRMLAELDAMDATLSTADSTARAESARQIRLLKSMELMSRARLFLYQSNFGLAELDVQAARDVLAGLASGGSAAEQATVSAAIERLDRTLVSLPDFPVAAKDDLDIAWQALLGRVPIATAPPTASPAASPGASPSDEPTASDEPSPVVAP